MSVEELKRKKVEELKARARLPHLFGFPWYKWAREFFENTTHKMQLLTAANQVSKSSTMIRKCIHWATDKELWTKLWLTEPRQFWYLYPDSNFATSEVELKWVPEFLPRDPLDPKYGWELFYKPNKKIDYIQFRSGVRVYFKTYEQDVHALQGSSVHAIFVDEELPENLFSELNFRLAATGGYFHAVFTATRGQEFWREAMEEIGNPIERFKGAWKRQISLFECTHYEDGRLSPWTPEKIQQVIDSCKDQNEVLRRVYGRFVRSDGRRYVFTKERNYKVIKFEEAYLVPDKWLLFSGVDWGSGNGKGRSKSAIVFVSVAPDFSRGRVVYAWRGDDTPTTQGDLFEKYVEVEKLYGYKPMIRAYDHAAVDFGTLAARSGVAFVKADKAREKGNGLLNTLFRYMRLSVDNNGDIGNERLATELSVLGEESEDGDDLADALRYAVQFIPFDMESVVPKDPKPLEGKPKGQREVGHVPQNFERDELSVDNELSEWGDMYD